MTRKARFPVMVLIALSIAALDRLTKMWFLDHFQLGESRPVTSWLHWTLVTNTGTAFGMLADNNRALLITAYVILFIFLYGARGLYERGRGWAFWGVALVLGGAIGNILDRHLYGHVIDFIDLRIWPVFNVADSAITVGAVFTAIGLLTSKETE